MATCWTCGSRTEYPTYRCSACQWAKIADIGTYMMLQGLEINVNKLAQVELRGFEALSDDLDRLAEAQEQGFREISDKLSEVASVIEWGFSELSWQLQQQIGILRSIDHTLKMPGQTQANEWRQMAEELRSRGILDKSEEFFVKSLGANPLDYRTYIGLAKTYLQNNEFDKAKYVLEESLSHGPEPETVDVEGYIFSVEVKVNKSGGWRAYCPALGKGLIYIPAYTREEALKENKEIVKSIVKSMIEKGELVPEEQIVRPKSYSYRLIGHVCACMEDYSGAVSALRSAVELSPTYHIARYDLAKYSAQAGDQGTCLSTLKSAVMGDSIYYYLAQKEKDLNPLLSEVGNLLNEIKMGASDRAKTGISKAEEMIEFAKEAIAEAQETLRKCRNKEEVLRPSIGKFEDAKSKLELAKRKVASQGYRAVLDAMPIGKEAYKLARETRNGVDEKREHWKKIHPGKVKGAFGTSGYALLCGIGGSLLGTLVFSPIGCVIRVFYEGFSSAGKGL